MAYTFDPIFAADPNNPANVAAGASVTIFDPADATMAAIAISDVTGSPLANPITVNANGFGPAFQHATLDRVGWVGGSFMGYLTSYEGMKEVAMAAADSADSAATDAAVSAQDAAASAQAAAAATQVSPAPSNIGIDTDGTPYFSSGAAQAFIFADTDGVPAFVGK